MSINRPRRAFSVNLARPLVVALAVAACNTTPAATTSAPTPASSIGQAGPVATAVVVPTAAPTAPASIAPSSAADITGTWPGTWTSQKYPGLTGHFTLNFKQQGSTLSGTISIAGTTCISAATITGALSGSEITFGVVQGAETVAYMGTWSGASMSGTWSITHGSGGACTTDAGDWKAAR